MLHRLRPSRARQSGQGHPLEWTSLLYSRIGFMSSTISAPVATLQELAHAAGLTLTPVEPGSDFTGAPTDRYIAALTADPSKNQGLELSQAFEQRLGADPRLV